MLAVSAQADRNILEQLGEQTILGQNLLDALAMGAGLLYLLYAPKLAQTSRLNLGSFLGRGRVQESELDLEPIKAIALFVMRQADGLERLVACQLGAGSMTTLAEQDLPAGVRIDDPNSSTQIGFLLNQFSQRLGNTGADLLLLGSKLAAQAERLGSLATRVEVLSTARLIDTLASCSDAELDQLVAWLNKPSASSLEGTSISGNLRERLESYSTLMPMEQANMASLLELSIALSWSRKRSA